MLSSSRRAFEEYSDCLLPHLVAEEAIGIPLTRAYFTPKEVQRLTNRLARSGPRCETGAIVHYVGPTKLRQAMKLQNAPLQRIAWILILNPRYRYYKRHMLRLLNEIVESPTKYYCCPFGAVYSSSYTRTIHSYCCWSALTTIRSSIRRIVTAASVANRKLLILDIAGSTTPANKLSRIVPSTRSKPVFLRLSSSPL